tara:strand:+ start:157 stop:402 length:246 start_codon:yes stop_codon:yes gene_type:complete
MGTLRRIMTWVITVAYVVVALTNKTMREKLNGRKKIMEYDNDEVLEKLFEEELEKLRYDLSLTLEEKEGLAEIKARERFYA